MEYVLPIGLMVFGVVILVAALISFLRKNNKRRNETDSATSFGVGDTHHSKRDNDNDSGGDSGGDGGGGD